MPFRTFLKQYLITALLLVACFAAHGQEFLFQNISNEMGLPSRECYNILQDSKGYLWLSTETGLCRYNGTNLTVFDGSNGLPEGATYALTAAPDGTLWGVTSQNRIICYKDGRLSEAPFSKTFSQLVSKRSLASQAAIDGNGELQITTKDKTFLIDTRRNHITVSTKADSATHAYLYMHNSLLQILKPVSSPTQAPQTQYAIIKIISGTKESVIPVPFRPQHFPHWRMHTCKIGSQVFFSIHNRLYRIDSNLNYTIQTLPANIICLYRDRHNGLWAGMAQQGVQYFPDPCRSGYSTNSLGGYSVSGVCEDNEAGIWCTTLEQGVFYNRNRKVWSHNQVTGAGKKVELLKNVNNHIFVSSAEGRLAMMNLQGTAHKLFHFDSPSVVTDIVKTAGGWLVSSNNFLLRTNDSLEKPHAVKAACSVCIPGAYRICLTSDNRTFVIHHSNIYELKGNQLVSFPKLTGPAGKAIADAGGQTLLLGSRDGLFFMHTGTGDIKKMSDTPATVNQILKRKNGEIWISAQTDGLYKLEGSAVSKIDIPLLEQAVVYDFTEDYHNRIWVGTNKGLIRIETKQGVFHAQNITRSEGLPSPEVYKVAADSQRVYLYTVEGLASFPVNESLENEQPPAIYLHSFYVNDTTPVLSLQNLSFPHHQHTFDITFDALTFKKPTTLLYSLHGSKDRLVANHGNSIHLSVLPPGHYELTVYAVNNSGIQSKKPVVISFSIRKPFWLQLWFMGLCLLLFAAALYLTIKLIIRKVKAEAQEKARTATLIAESQLSALQSQMNPHFIFNAINSIQSYILKKQDQEAYNYLAKFSKLIRKVLNNSREQTIPLFKEIDTIEHYVALEQMRFSNSFSFNLDIAADVDPYEVMVPVMLIQPYVENAIWHGLMHLNGERKGILSIGITRQQNLLRITVEDNGIGRQQAAAYRQSTPHHPVAMTVTEQRINIIRSMQHYEGVEIRISDIDQTPDGITGTRIELFLPFIYNTES